MTNYEQPAAEFLAKTGTTFKAVFTANKRYFDDDKESRDVYRVTLKNNRHTFRFNFGQSLRNSDYGNTPPTAYDVLACLTKYPVYSFEDFCSEYGYDTDSRKAYKTYKAVKREWENVDKLFTSEEIELLQEIN